MGHSHLQSVGQGCGGVFPDNTLFMRTHGAPGIGERLNSCGTER